MTSVNAALKGHRGFALVPTLDLAGKGGAPRMALQSQSLFAFMLMEAAMIAAHGVRLTSCKQCDGAFVTGPLTWRRSHARYCSDRCRVAAMRSRNADRVVATR
jgi:hypothetical protein